MAHMYYEHVTIPARSRFTPHHHFPLAKGFGGSGV
jgi:hypothetical protein